VPHFLISRSSSFPLPLRYSRSHTGRAPRPTQVFVLSLGWMYFAGTFLPVSGLDFVRAPFAPRHAFLATATPLSFASSASKASILPALPCANTEDNSCRIASCVSKVCSPNHLITLARCTVGAFAIIFLLLEGSAG